MTPIRKLIMQMLNKSASSNMNRTEAISVNKVSITRKSMIPIFPNLFNRTEEIHSSDSNRQKRSNLHPSRWSNKTRARLYRKFNNLHHFSSNPKNGHNGEINRNLNLPIYPLWYHNSPHPKLEPRNRNQCKYNRQSRKNSR